MVLSVLVKDEKPSTFSQTFSWVEKFYYPPQVAALASFAKENKSKQSKSVIFQTEHWSFTRIPIGSVYSCHCTRVYMYDCVCVSVCTPRSMHDLHLSLCRWTGSFVYTVFIDSYSRSVGNVHTIDHIISDSLANFKLFVTTRWYQILGGYSKLHITSVMCYTNFLQEFFLPLSRMVM